MIVRMFDLPVSQQAGIDSTGLENTSVGTLAGNHFFPFFALGLATKVRVN